MCEDFSHRYGPEKALYLGYMDVNKRLEAFQSSLSLTYGIPEPLKPLDVVEEVMNRAEELQMGNDRLSSLNDEQRQVADTILESARSDAPQNCFFIDAPGGTGKTYLFSCLAHCLEGENIAILCLASSGIASNLLPRGITVHT